MAWYESLTGTAFRNWLVSVAGGGRVPQGQRLDPFATSMRDFKAVSGWLGAIEQSEPLEARGGAGRQQVTDLSAAGLIHGRDPAVLTDLGQETLRRWREVGIEDNVPEHELSRCLAVVACAMALGAPLYVKMVTFWQELRAVLGAEALLGSPHALYLVSYLNQQNDGYSPWQVLRSGGAPIPGEHIDWDAVAAVYADDGDASAAVEALRCRVHDAETRASGRTNFCRAMELFCLGPVRAIAALDAWHLAEEVRRPVRRLLETMVLSSAALDDLLRLVKRRKNVVLYGPPGTGKTRAALGLCEAWELMNGPDTVFSVTFHPSYSYEDFVEGFRPKGTDDGTGETVADTSGGTFILQPGLLLLACKRAQELIGAAHGSSPKAVLLMVDEINRADVARVLGELITYIEADKRGKKFRLSQSPAAERTIPPNLYLVGTMNTADKSISLLDIALRRRFAFVEYPPDESVFDSEASWLSSIGGMHLATLLHALNARLAAAGIDPDRAIGHSLLSVSADATDPIQRLHERFEYDIYPLICEYCFMDRRRIGELLADLVTPNGSFRRGMGNDEFIAALSSLIPSDELGEVDTEDDAAASDDESPAS